jgi:hypothetical protein
MSKRESCRFHREGDFDLREAETPMFLFPVAPVVGFQHGDITMRDLGEVIYRVAVLAYDKDADAKAHVPAFYRSRLPEWLERVETARAGLATFQRPPSERRRGRRGGEGGGDDDVIPCPTVGDFTIF